MKKQYVMLMRNRNSKKSNSIIYYIFIGLIFLIVPKVNCSLQGDGNEFFHFDNIKTINLSKINNGIISVDYYDINNNTNSIKFNEESNYLIRQSWHPYNSKFEFTNKLNKQKFKIDCAACRLCVLDNMYILYDNGINYQAIQNIILIDPAVPEIKIFKADSIKYLGEDNQGVYFKIFDTNLSYLRSDNKIIKFDSLKEEILVETPPFSLYPHSIDGGIVRGNKDYAFINLDSITRNQFDIYSKQINTLIWLYGKYYEHPSNLDYFIRNKMECYPKFYDSILYFYDYFYKDKPNEKSMQFKISSIDKNGKIQDIFSEINHFEERISGFMIYKTYMIIDLVCSPERSNINSKKITKSRIVVIDLKTNEEIEIKKVNINLIKFE